MDRNRPQDCIKNRRSDPRYFSKPEALKYEYKGFWSRRIDHEHRLIYSITDKSLLIISCYSHY
jgi:toxin YoeB